MIRKKCLIIITGLVILLNIFANVKAYTFLESEPNENLWLGYNGRHIVRGSGSYSNNIVAVYENEEENKIRLKLSTNGGSSFSYTYDVDSSVYSNDVAIAIDSSNVVHIVYKAQTASFNQLRYKTFTLSTRTFSSYTTLWDYFATDPAISINSNGHLYVVFSDNVDDIELKKYTTSWSSATKIADCSTTYGCDLPDIDFDYDNTAHIVWRQETDNGYDLL